jgi:hypothetical protein
MGNMVAVLALWALAFLVLIFFLSIVGAVVASLWEVLTFFLSIPSAIWRGELKSRPIPRENTVMRGLYAAHRGEMPARPNDLDILVEVRRE